MKRLLSPGIEPLESRIAPAIVIANPAFDIKAGAGSTSATIDLAKLVDPAGNHRTVVEFITNFTIPGASGPGVIRLEMFDDKTPLTVQNFLSYVNNANAANDYDGTYFHRLVKDFVLQGGGYNPPPKVNDFGPHVDTPFTVHNEFFADDPELDPVAGTLAMAKVGTSNGGGPHSATSEFFINYADNSGILDSQNGGFTVFGKVVQGMDVVNALANLRLAPINNLGGNGNEGIPTTAATGAQVGDQTIRIVEARVVPPLAANANGHTFSVQVFDNVTGLPSNDLLSATIDANNQLKLAYKSGKAGVAKVKVSVSKTGEATVDDEFLVTVQPNLIAEVQNNIGGTVVPGQKGTTNVRLVNNGGGAANGDLNVRLFLSEITSGNSDAASGFTLEESGDGADIEISADAAKRISLAGGRDTVMAVKYEITAEDAAKLKVGSNYRLLAKVETPVGSTIQELFTDDNIGNIRDVHVFKNAFGTVDSGRAPVALTLAENSIVTGSELLTFVLKGPGSGEATRNADGSLTLELSGTTLASSLSIKTAKGVVADISELHITGTIGSLKLANTNLHSHLSISGGVKSIQLGDLGGTGPTFSGNIDIGGTSNLGTVIQFGTVRDFSLDSTTTIKSLKAKAWLNSNAVERETLTLNGIGSLSIAGNFEANLNDRSEANGGTLKIGGNIVGSTIATRSAFKKITAVDVSDAAFNLGAADRISALATAKSSIAFGNVTDSAVNASHPVTSLSALAWKNTATSPVEELTFRGLGSLKIATDLEAGVSQESALPVKSIAVGGVIRNAVIQSAGDISAISAGTFDGVDVFAGVSAKPTQISDLVSARNIGSITAKSAFLNTDVIAAQIAKISVAGVNGASGSGLFGFYADVIKSYVRKGGPKLSNLDAPAPDPGAYDPVAPNYEVRVF